MRRFSSRRISRLQHGRITSARLPVATALQGQPISSSIRSIMPSSMPAVAYTAPERIASAVLVAITFFGGVTEISGSRLVPSESARSPSRTPGMMAPPRKLPFSSTTSIVVAVPRFRTMTGFP